MSPRAVLAASIDQWLRLPRSLRALVPIAGVIILWWSSSRTPDQGPPSISHDLFHNSMHVVAYGLLAASVWLAWSDRPATGAHRFRSGGAWLLTTLYGLVDELHQGYVPGRVSSAADLASDAFGAALAIVVVCGLSGVSSTWRRTAVLWLLASLASVGLATFAGW